MRRRILTPPSLALACQSMSTADVKRGSLPPMKIIKRARLQFSATPGWWLWSVGMTGCCLWRTWRMQGRKDITLLPCSRGSSRSSLPRGLLGCCTTLGANYIELSSKYVALLPARPVSFSFFPSIIWSLTSLPGLDGVFRFSMLLATKAHARLYITRRNALVLAARMGKVASDAGLSYRNWPGCYVYQGYAISLVPSSPLRSSRLQFHRRINLLNQHIDYMNWNNFVNLGSWLRQKLDSLYLKRCMASQKIESSGFSNLALSLEWAAIKEDAIERAPSKQEYPSHTLPCPTILGWTPRRVQNCSD